MDHKLKDILEDREQNYLLPFYWQHGDHTDKIPEQIQTIYESGCRAFCVESRPHPDFAGDGWWRDMDIIIEEAKKRDMKVWILDDNKFPTGHANGLLAKKYPHLRQWNIAEKHVDIVGPMMSGSIMVPDNGPEHQIIGVYAYKRHKDKNERCYPDGIDLTNNMSDGYVYWDVPEGVWRIFFYFKTRQGIFKDFIDMTNEESVHVLIEAVYEPHYEHYKEHFGKTIEGFFSDEPCFGNDFRYGVTDMRAGKRNIRLPWNDKVMDIMEKHLGYDPISKFNLLWYEDDQNGDLQCELRYAYMNAICELYSNAFNKQLADWCQEHGVKYIGHIIEEASTSVGAGHFFKATRWQDYSGIDVVLHQVMPGMDDFTHSTCGSTGLIDSEFYHYCLAKLGASMSHIEPRMKGRAMCEALGAYGWAEDTSVMKYIMDHFMVRGINHFVPHAFDSKFPDPDCPPHFGIEGKDPSFDGFSALMRYTNKVCHLLCGAEHVSRVAILYEAENEWTSRFGNAMKATPVAKALYDAHIDFDIVPYDYIDSNRIVDGKLCLCNEKFEKLIVPFADHIADNCMKILKEASDKGLDIIFVNSTPENINFNAQSVTLNSLADKLTAEGFIDVHFHEGCDKIRVYHCRRNGNDIFMFFNEDMSHIDTKVKLSCSGKYVRMDLANELFYGGNTDDGEIELSLDPAQSIFIIFGHDCGFDAEPSTAEEIILESDYELSLADCEDLSDFRSVGRFNHYYNITSPDFKPHFSGKMKYDFNFTLEGKYKRLILDLGYVGQCCKVEINGHDLGARFSAPYQYDITNVVINGDNTLSIVVCNTLVQKVRDRFSSNMLIKPSGLLGDIKIKKYQ